MGAFVGILARTEIDSTGSLTLEVLMSRAFYFLILFDSINLKQSKIDCVRDTRI